VAKPSGVRSLALIRESGSTARVLNLAVIFERFGQTEEYAAKPMFRSTTLNRALILKHAVRIDERDLFVAAPITATKVVLPFAAKELHLGGRAILVGERAWERAIREAAGQLSEADMTADLELLRLLNTLPSFDPFLLRERLRHSGYEPSRVYFDMSEADILRMREFTGREIEQLVGLAYANGGDMARDMSQKLADKLMTDETAKALDPLRMALQLAEDEYREGVFSWKGFLYYKWISVGMRENLAALTREMLSARVQGADNEAREQLAEIRRRIADMISQSSQKIENALLDYGTAFAGLSSGKPGVFRDFLRTAPTLFIPIGEAIGVVKHIESFWRFRFPPGRPQILQADEAFEIYCDFDATLGGMAILKDPAPARAM